MMGDASAGDAPVMNVHIEGSGPPLIFLHGGYGCWRHWARNVGPLSEHFTVYAFDLPCYWLVLQPSIAISSSPAASNGELHDALIE